MSNDKKLGFIMMLDVSDSMSNALPMVKIDSKAFVRSAHSGDQFGVNAFSDNAWWVYPTGNNPKIVTVTDGLKETENAVNEIEKLKCVSMTNMGEAIKLGNQMINQAATPLKAFVLLSDGYHNRGTDPRTVLGDEPPIYIAGLDIIDTTYFKNLIAKNKKSQFYNEPVAYKMMCIYNDILADADEANLSMNSLKSYCKGSDYFIESFSVMEDDNDAQVSVVWSDKKYKYTSQYPSGTNINIVLIDPNNNITNYKPDIIDDGYCIYNLHNVLPGEWKVLVQYSLAESIYGTAGGFEFHTSVKTNLLLPSYIESKENIDITVEALRDNKQIENVTVNAHISQPIYSTDEVLNRFENKIKEVELDSQVVDNEYNRLKVLREQKLQAENIDILPLKHTIHNVTVDSNGNYSLSLENTLNQGIYSVKVEISGIDPVTKRPFRSLKAGSVVVG